MVAVADSRLKRGTLTLIVVWFLSDVIGGASRRKQRETSLTCRDKPECKCSKSKEVCTRIVSSHTCASELETEESKREERHCECECLEHTYDIPDVLSFQTHPPELDESECRQEEDSKQTPMAGCKCVCAQTQWDCPDKCGGASNSSDCSNPCTCKCLTKEFKCPNVDHAPPTIRSACLFSGDPHVVTFDDFLAYAKGQPQKRTDYMESYGTYWMVNSSDVSIQVFNTNMKHARAAVRILGIRIKGKDVVTIKSTGKQDNKPAELIYTCGEQKFQDKVHEFQSACASGGVIFAKESTVGANNYKSVSISFQRSIRVTVRIMAAWEARHLEGSIHMSNKSSQCGHCQNFDQHTEDEGSFRDRLNAAGRNVNNIPGVDKCLKRVPCTELLFKVDEGEERYDEQCEGDKSDVNVPKAEPQPEESCDDEPKRKERCEEAFKGRIQQLEAGDQSMAYKNVLECRRDPDAEGCKAYEELKEYVIVSCAQDTCRADDIGLLHGEDAILQLHDALEDSDMDDKWNTDQRF
eukprot:TRINITY_DN18959_c0_g1_i1.p1 TRINITY_DN18959_c0_g1~~TRINITY_DN18959_c0_g1_i1.p1  ORF type:complete len:522 (-),score=36.91 TRINITY_DN18959_c0_g1_i1:134-1699(-)